MIGGRVRLKENGILDEDFPTLLETVFKYLSDNLNIIYHQNETNDNFELRSGIVIPNEICDRFLEYQQDCNEDVNDKFVYIFRDTQRTPLKYVALRNSSITDDGMKLLCMHPLISLSLWYCNNITTESWNTVVRQCPQLKSLELGRYVDMLKYSEPKEKTPIDFQLELPNLRRLILNAVVLQPTLRFDHLKELTHLDLTASILADFSLEALVNLPNLTTLILFNVWTLEEQFPTICKMKQLTTLDISTAHSSKGTYSKPDWHLTMIVESLPLLTHLDISGTNLAGTGVAQFGSKANTRSSDIPGLVSRINNPLQFLGLYNTEHSACRRHDIPALAISGEANEEQIITAAMAYQDRPIMITKILNDLYHMLRFESCKSISKALDIVLSSMDRHLRLKHMQISGSATLFYIVKGCDKTKLGTPLKRHLIRTLLNGMWYHLIDDTMMRNGCLTLCQFTIPNDVLFDYERLVKILLCGVADSMQEVFVQRLAIYILNSMACQVDGKKKLYLGDMGAISTMLDLISYRLGREIFDDVMEVAWSTMWNVTDETAQNCERFLEGRGMEYFLECLKCFPEKEELLRNMMGLLGNVAEVKRLRHRLMTTEFITVFYNLLDSKSDGIEVSYNAAGVLAHIASDGPAAWTIDKPSRKKVLKRMEEAIDRWQEDSERNINYRSFEPILGLLRCYETPECQLWAAWALVNLTTVYPKKYCPLFQEEHGMELVNEILEHPSPFDKVKKLVEKIIRNCTLLESTDMSLDG